MDRKMSVSEFRGHLMEAINQAAYGSDRIVIERRGKVLGAFISAADLKFFEELEDANDLALAHANVAASRRAGEPNLPIAEATERVAEAISRRNTSEAAVTAVNPL
jgi:PHD/YefM family antitoxin component YafN of YafNO toxin-antitoxin module